MKRKPSIARWGLFFLTTVPTSLGCSSDGYTCPLIDCEGDEVRVRLVSENDPEVSVRLAPGNYVAHVTADENTWSCGLVINADGTEERECELDNPKIAFSSFTIGVRDAPWALPSFVEVTIEQDGAVLVDAEFSPRYSIVKAGCDTCLRAEHQLALDDEWLVCLTQLGDRYEWVPCQDVDEP